VLGTIASIDLRHHHRDLIELLLTGAARPAVAGRWTFSLG
jgi:hypothetical protein